MSVYQSVSSKIYDKRDDFDFDTVHLPFLDDDVPRHVTYGVNFEKHFLIFIVGTMN